MARAVKDLVETRDNVAAVKALSELRHFLGTRTGRLRITPMSREDFSVQLALELDGKRIASSTLRDWESGDHVIPGPINSAASRLLARVLGEQPSMEYYLSLEWISRPRPEFKEPWFWAADAA